MSSLYVKFWAMLEAVEFYGLFPVRWRGIFDTREEATMYLMDKHQRMLQSGNYHEHRKMGWEYSIAASGFVGWLHMRLAQTNGELA